MASYNPYDRFELPRENRVKTIKYLTEDELAQLEATDVPEKLKFTKDIFLLGCYTGLRWSDIQLLDRSCYQKQGGKEWLIGTQKKTSNEYAILLLPEGKKILDKWGWDMRQNAISTIDINLKTVACLAGINRILTMHMSRHTFATRALSKGVRMEVVSKMLGHTDIKMTQVYAQVLRQDVVKGFEMLMK